MYGDLLEDVRAEAPLQLTADRARARELVQALATLEPRLRRVVTLRFGLDGSAPYTLDEIGADVGVTRERVRQLETRALRELRLAAPGLAQDTSAPSKSYGAAAICISRRPARRRSESSSICRTRSRVRPSRRPISSSVFGSSSIRP